MKIGIFDSGLGGLIVTKSLVEALPQYDYLYLGDTARVPYGNRSQEAIYSFTCEAVEFLFREGCGLIIVACNTASAEALRHIQEEYLPEHYPDRRVLGVLIPAAEASVSVTKTNRIGVLATAGTVGSGAFEREIRKLRPEAVVFQQAAPLLVPLIENDSLRHAPPILADYLAPLLEAGIDTLVLGCTHYPYLKTEIRNIIGEDIALVSQDEVLASKLADYLARHSDLALQLSREGTQRYLLTDIAPGAYAIASTLFGQPIEFERVDL